MSIFSLICFVAFTERRSSKRKNANTHTFEMNMNVLGMSWYCQGAIACQSNNFLNGKELPLKRMNIVAGLLPVSLTVSLSCIVHHNQHGSVLIRCF